MLTLQLAARFDRLRRFFQRQQEHEFRAAFVRIGEAQVAAVGLEDFWLIGMPKPVPRCLVVKNGSKILALASGVRPGPLFLTEMRRKDWPFWLSSEAWISIHTGSLHAAREFEQIAKHLLDPEGVTITFERIALDRLMQFGFAVLAGGFKALPGFLPDVFHRAR